MNDQMVVSRVGLHLIASFEGSPRLVARLCEGGRYELSYGCTTWPDGRPVAIGETCDIDQALKLFAFHIHRFEAIVKKHVKVPLTQLQFDALVALVYNIGEANFAGGKGSTVLRMTNMNRFEDAAAAFSMFVFATKQPGQRTNEPLDWFQDPDGNPCAYMRALRGLLRRHLAEGLVFLGYQWEQACAEDAIFLRANRVYDPDQKRNEDRVTVCTTFADVMGVAMYLPKLTMPVVDVAMEAPFDLDAWEAKVNAYALESPLPEMPVYVERQTQPPAPPPSSTASQSTPVAVPKANPAPAPAAPAPKPIPTPPSRKEQEAGVNASQTSGVDWSSPKSLILSRRFWGIALLLIGRFWFWKTGSDDALRAASDPITQELFAGIMVMMIAMALAEAGHLLHWWGSRKARRPLA